MSAPRLILYGHFGSGNLGNDSTLEAVLHNIGKYKPSAKILCVCARPDIVAERYGIETLPIEISGHGREHQPTSRGLRVVKALANRITDESDFWFRRTTAFRGADEFIVVGTGAADDMGVRPWNAPYYLYRWCNAANLAGVRVAFLSIGAGPILNRASRALMLGALRAAKYRSFRDDVTFNYLKSVGFDTSSDSLYPDLVFSLPEKAWKNSHASSPGQPLTVGLGVMGYYGWRHDTHAGESIYLDYLDKMKRFMYWLLGQGYNIRLINGDVPDKRPVEDLLHLVKVDGHADWQGRIHSKIISSTDDLFQQISETDMVVATRFHNVLCSLMLGKPVISLGYHQKNNALLAEMGLGSYCQHVESFSVDQLIQQFQSLIKELDQASIHINQKCAQYRQALDEQYQKILLP